MQLEFSSRTLVPPCLPLGPRGTCVSVGGVIFYRSSNISPASEGSQSALKPENNRKLLCSGIAFTLLLLLKGSPTTGTQQGSLFIVKVVQQSRVQRELNHQQECGMD